MRNAKNDNKKKKKSFNSLHGFDMTTTLTQTFYLLLAREKMYFCPERSLVKSILKLLQLYFIISVFRSEVDWFGCWTSRWTSR